MTAVVGNKYVYEHPDMMGFGVHHVNQDANPNVPPLHQRPAQIYGLPPLESLNFLNLSEEQTAKLQSMHDRTMDDLDMKHGTVVTVMYHDDARGTDVVEWTDQFGDEHVTGLTPEKFQQFFKPVDEETA